MIIPISEDVSLNDKKYPGVWAIYFKKKFAGSTLGDGVQLIESQRGRISLEEIERIKAFLGTFKALNG